MSEPLPWYPAPIGSEHDLHARLVKVGMHAILVDADGSSATPNLKEVYGLLTNRHSEGDRLAELIDLTDLGDDYGVLHFTATGGAPLDGEYSARVTAKEILLQLREFRLQSVALTNRGHWLKPSDTELDAKTSRPHSNSWSRWIVAIHTRDLEDCGKNIQAFTYHCRAAGISLLVKIDAEALAAETPFNKSLLNACDNAIVAHGANLPGGPMNDTGEVQLYSNCPPEQSKPQLSFWRRWFRG